MPRPSPTDLERAILATLCYFDLSSYPLTLLELQRWLYASPNGIRLNLPQATIGDIDRVLITSPWLRERVEQQRGFIFLRGRSAIIEQRLHRAEIAERKFRRARRIVNVFRRLPWIRLIAVCNTLAYANSRDDSDIDLFIVTRPGAVWSTRLLTTTFTASLGLRPRGHEGRDTICLSFFATSDSLDFRQIQRHPHDVYLHYWINQVIPLYDRDGAYEEFLRQNDWIHAHLPNAQPYRSGLRRRVDGLAPARAQHPSASARSSFERVSRAIQERILPDRLRALANHDTRVVVTSQMLKFHDNDRREQYREQFEHRFRELAA